MTGYEAVLYFALWTVVMLLMYVSHRIPLALAGKKPANYWTRGNQTDDPAIFVRASHAHANCLETFPLFAAVVIIAGLMNQSAVVDGLAAYVVYARVAQGVVHLIGTSFALVLTRATFFLIQVVLIVYMALQLIGVA